MNRILVGLAVAALVGSSFAAGGDSSEKGVSKSSLKIFSGGAGVGAVFPVSKEFEEASEGVFIDVSLIGSWQFRENVALFADVSWHAPGNSYGGDVGIDYLFSTSSVRPFAGAGIGGHRFDRELGEDEYGVKIDKKLNDVFGLSFTAHIGCALDVTETVQVRLRVPYHIILTKTKDSGFGVDFGVMFTDKFSKIKKLNY